MVSGGSRKGAGRKARSTPKSKGIWCGQITDEQRDFIIQWLSPEERYQALMAAANKACSGCGVGGGLNGQVTHPAPLTRTVGWFRPGAKGYEK